MSEWVTLTWGLSILFMILFPITLAVWWQSRYRIGWRPFLYGALIFGLFQIIIRVPAVLLIGRAVTPALQESQALQILYFAALGLSAGLFESVGRWAGYRWLFRDRLPYDWVHGIAYGIGHGGIESALLVGLNSLASWLQAMQLTTMSVAEVRATYPEAALPQILAAREQFFNLAWHEPLLGAIERLLTIPFHVALSLVVLLVFTRHQTRWLCLAVLVHGFVDWSIIMVSQILGWPAWATELYLALWTAASLWFIVKLRTSPWVERRAAR